MSARGGRAKAKAELIACMKELFEEDPERKLSIEEIKTKLLKKSQMPDFKHKGCKVDIDKILERMVLSRMDKDGDEKISLEEFENFMEKKMGKFSEGDD